MNTYYKPSGAFSPLSIIYFLGLGLIAFPILGLIYAYCIWYIPFIYINFLIAAAFGFTVGYSINWLVITKGKVRNTILAIVFGLLGGLIAMYFHWAVWVDLVINAGESYGNNRIGVTVSNIKILQVFELALNPSALFELIGAINEYGTWGIKGNAISGTFLTIIWVIEMLIVVGISVILPLPAASYPFCERSNQWFTEKILPPFNVIEDTDTMTNNLESSNPNSFNNLALKESDNVHYSEFTLFSSANDESYLSIKNMIGKINDKEELEYDDDEFIEYISISNQLKNELLEKAKLFN